jgi:hypothetical protein
MGTPTLTTFVLVGLAIEGPALACSCAPVPAVLPLGEPEGQNENPSNGVFRLYEAAIGAVEDGGWGIYDADGIAVPFTLERFEEPLGAAWVELRPDDELPEGTSYTLRPATATDGLGYLVAGGPDHQPPILTDAWFERVETLGKTTSCGETKWTELGL